MKIIKGGGVKGGGVPAFFFFFQSGRKELLRNIRFGYVLYEISISVDLKAYNVIKKYLRFN